MSKAATFKVVASAAFVALSMAFVQPAQAQTMPDLIQRAQEAIRASAEQGKADAASRPAGPATGVAAAADPATSVNLGIFGAGKSDDVAAPMVSTGGNVYTAANCVTFFSGSTIYTMLVTTNGTGIFSSSAPFGVTLNAACMLRGPVAINVTSVSGSSFTWDAVAY